jgi:putative NIF3 family GTP cyclohydrolase 1 type 2
LIITHHPLFFKAIKNINYNKPDGRLLKSIITSDVAVYSAHTNLDAAEAGMNQVLAEKLGLKNIQPLYTGCEDRLVKLTVFVPFTHIEQVREAIHQAGQDILAATRIAVSGLQVWEPFCHWRGRIRF